MGIRFSDRVKKFINQVLLSIIIPLPVIIIKN